MVRSMTAAKLLSDLKARGVEFQTDGDRVRFRPVEWLTPIELDAIRRHKTSILALLRPASPFDRDNSADAEPAPVTDIVSTGKPVCRCGSTTWRDVAIHDSQSVRRDCARCGRFLGWPLWYGRHDVLAVELAIRKSERCGEVVAHA